MVTRFCWNWWRKMKILCWGKRFTISFPIVVKLANSIMRGGIFRKGLRVGQLDTSSKPSQRQTTIINKKVRTKVTGAKRKRNESYWSYTVMAKAIYELILFYIFILKWLKILPHWKSTFFPQSCPTKEVKNLSISWRANNFTNLNNSFGIILTGHQKDCILTIISRIRSMI